MFQNYTILVNRNHIYQPSDFKDMVFTKTTDIEGKEILVEEETYRHYLAFKEHLHQKGIEVSVTSGYRSLEEQKKAIEELKNVYTDESKLYEKVAPVGASEHHTGLALDITISNLKQYQERLTKYYTEEELETREKLYQWIASVCSNYGFILRYPKDKIEITGYSYEPWHFRYVGKKVAKIIMDNHLTLEEYLGTQ